MKILLLNDIEVEITELDKKILYAQFDSTQWETAMHFFRFQEYYSDDDAKSKIFPIFSLINWYVQNKGNGEIFSYPADKKFFAIPGIVFKSVFEMMYKTHTLDQTNFERNIWILLREIANHFLNVKGFVRHENMNWDFYLIASAKDYIPTEKEKLDALEDAKHYFSTLQLKE